MRVLINELIHIFGAQNSAAITNWVNKQYLFNSVYDGASFTLHDLDENEILTVVKSACNELGLTLQMLLDGVWVVPTLTPRKMRLAVSVELRPELFRIATKDVMAITEEGMVLAGDSVLITGSDRHIKHEKHSGSGKVVQLAYFNAFANPGEGQIPLSCSMTGDEINEVKRSYVENKFCGADPFDEIEWAEIQLASVYRRFINSSMFSALFNVLSVEQTITICAIARFGHDKFDHNCNDKALKVYSSQGREIGHKIFRHNIASTVSNEAIADVLPFKRPASKPLFRQENNAVNQSCDDCVTEWGVF